MNFFNTSTPPKGQEVLTTLLQHQNVTINRIVSNALEEGVWYDQDEDEWLLLLEGTARLEVDGDEKRLEKGDMLFIGAHTKHQLLGTSADALWLTVHITS